MGVLEQINVKPTRSFGYYLRMATLIFSALFFILGLLLFLSSIVFSPSGLIVGFYVMVFSIMIALTEIELKIFLKKLKFLRRKFTRGVFYFFVGTLVFAVLDFGSVLSIILCSFGIILVLISFLYMGFGIVNRKAEEFGFGTLENSESGYVTDDNAMPSSLNTSYDRSAVTQDVADDSSAQQARRVAPISDEEYVNAGLGDYVQTKVGGAVASAARNTEYQQKAGQYVSNYANNAQTQQYVGQAIADNSDNDFVKYMATNQTFQSGVGSMVGSMATNETAQRLAGDSVARAAEDKEMQRKVAGAVASGAKTSAQSGWGAANAYLLSE